MILRPTTTPIPGRRRASSPQTGTATRDAVFRSILFPDPATAPRLSTDPPDFFGDLHLDRVMAAIVRGREEYALEPFFHTPLDTPADIAYRHEVFDDLRAPTVRAALDRFTTGMCQMRTCRAHADRRHHLREQQSWLLAAARRYTDTLSGLASDLTGGDLTSRGLLGVRDYLTAVVHSPQFTDLVGDLTATEAALTRVRYCLTVRGDHVTVSRYTDEEDYSATVRSTFRHFAQGDARQHRPHDPTGWEMDHVEAQIVDLVARLHPDEFGALDRFCDRHRDPLDTTLVTFDREIQFYLAFLDHMDRLETTGLRFCLPEVGADDHTVRADTTFDIALATTLVPDTPVVCNDIALTGPERVLVVTGPNQGGKTTLARTFGQLHYLGRLGCPVPGTYARLHLYDRLFTHFEHEEAGTTLTGTLQDELERIHDIVNRATADSVVIMNETFTSTTVHDARLLGTAVLDRILALDLLAVYVTFVDELSTLGEGTVSMVASVDADDPAQRTYRLTRRPADGRAYATAVANRYGLTYQQVKERRSCTHT